MQTKQAQPGPEGTAAQLKAVQLQAPKRRAAIKQLQGIDVRYHLEAEAILIAALRVDPSECVRYEAALTLTTLPTCTDAIAKALQVCVESSSRDGNPAELSPRVRWQAEAALAKCQCCLPSTSMEELSRPEYPSSDNTSASAAQMASSTRGFRFSPAAWVQPNKTLASGMIENPQPVVAPSSTFESAQLSRPTNLIEVFSAARSPSPDQLKPQ